VKYSENAGNIAYYAEKYLFSIYFAVAVVQSGYSTYKSVWWKDVISFWGEDWNRVLFPASQILSAILLMIIEIMVCIIFVMAEKPKRKPEGAKEILIPFLATFSFAFYSSLPPFLPAVTLQNLMPVSVRYPIFIGAVTLLFVGIILKILSLYYLRHSFAIFVQVKEFVFSGPYAYIRHPMYTAFILMIMAVVLSHFSLAMIAVALINVGLLCYRAKLEEKALAAHDFRYREYMEHTGFLIPSLKSMLRGQIDSPPV
jgi:protein-S-isoprenylcysteine O-methyltransferase Ste14